VRPARMSGSVDMLLTAGTPEDIAPVLAATR
jgi:hypothetical protein